MQSERLRIVILQGIYITIKITSGSNFKLTKYLNVSKK